MGKLLPVLAGGAVISGVSATAAVMSTRYSVDSVLPETLKGFRDGAMEGCVSELFGGLDRMRPSSGDFPEVEAAGKIGENFFPVNTPVQVSDPAPAAAQSRTARPEGCLVVNWNRDVSVKANAAGGEWAGNLRILWAMRRGGKGFVTFNVLKSDKEGETVKFRAEGQSFVLENAAGIWSITKQLTVGTNKSVAQTDVGTKFPKAHNSLAGMGGRPFWGLMKDAAEAEKIAQIDEDAYAVQTKPSASFQGYWTWAPEAAKAGKSTSGPKAHEWASNFDVFWENLYEKAKWDMAKATENLRGRWTDRLIYGPAADQR